jgi:hypothetical protein
VLLPPILNSKFSQRSSVHREPKRKPKAWKWKVTAQVSHARNSTTSVPSPSSTTVPHSSLHTSLYLIFFFLFLSVLSFFLMKQGKGLRRSGSEGSAGVELSKYCYKLSRCCCGQATVFVAFLVNLLLREKQRIFLCVLINLLLRTSNSFLSLRFFAFLSLYIWFGGSLTSMDCESMLEYVPAWQLDP